VGLLNSFNRWRLARKGLSSGRKRRTSRDDTLAHTVGRSVWVRWALYALFAGMCAVMALQQAQSETGTDQYRLLLSGFMVAVTAVALFQVQYRDVAESNGRVVLVLGGLLAHLVLLLGVGQMADANELPPEYRFLLIPFAFVPMIHSVLLGRRVGYFSVVYAALLGCVMIGTQVDWMLPYMVVSLVSGFTGVYIVDRARKRGRLLRAGLYVGALVVLLSWMFGRIQLGFLMKVPELSEIQRLGVASLVAFGVNVVAAMVVSGILPILEGIFGLTTEISWLELSDLNHKLLRRMQLEAPGTFHHSLVVAALSESAAETIGANAVMARVGAYFHDIGKVNKPMYFIENQGDLAENPHDSLTPTMSALIIIAHVKDGVDLALRHKLNPRIINVIREHHGDSLVQFFYRKAQEQRKEETERVEKGIEDPQDLPKIEEKSFRYPGPRPRSKESGIISLADAVESASRTLKKPTPAKVRALIEEIVQSRMGEGQLDRCDLTLKELTAVKESFGVTLRSMLHSRIDYPKDENGGNGGNGERKTDGGRKSDRKNGGNGERSPEGGAAKKSAGNGERRPEGGAAKRSAGNDERETEGSVKKSTGNGGRRPEGGAKKGGVIRKPGDAAPSSEPGRGAQRSGAPPRTPANRAGDKAAAKEGGTLRGATDKRRRSSAIAERR
jgi:putative nucleotidyltransferase with HDIG domain